MEVTTGRATSANWRISSAAHWRSRHSTTLGVELFASVAKSQAPAPAALPKPGVTLQDMERSLLEATLLATDGNRTRTAEMMGVSLRTVRNKIREYGLAAREAAV